VPGQLRMPAYGRKRLSDGRRIAVIDEPDLLELERGLLADQLALVPRLVPTTGIFCFHGDLLAG